MSVAVAPEKGSRPRARAGRVIAGIAVGAGLVGVAVLAVLGDGSPSGDGRSERAAAARGGDAVEASATPPPEAKRFRHVFESDYVGPVWITVEAPDAGTRSVTIKWGPWQRRITHQGSEALTYHFWKGVTPAGERVPPTTVVVDPGAEVTFGAGAIPEGAVDVNKEWEPAA